MEMNKKTIIDIFYGMWISAIIGIVMALTLNLLVLWQKNTNIPSEQLLLRFLFFTLVAALIGIFIGTTGDLIFYFFRGIRNKYILGIAISIVYYILTFIISYLLGYKDIKILAIVSCIPSIYGAIFSYFEHQRMFKLNVGLQKKKDELNKKIGLSNSQGENNCG